MACSIKSKKKNNSAKGILNLLELSHIIFTIFFSIVHLIAHYSFKEYIASA